MSNSTLNLNIRQQNIYHRIELSLKAGRDCVSLPAFCDIQECFEIYKLLLGDYPELFYYDNCNISTSGSKMYLKTLYNSIEKFKKIEQFNSESKKIIDSVINNKMNDAQKVLVIHNYLAKNVKYNVMTMGTKFASELHTAYGAIVNKVAVCEGISYAFSHLLHLCGIKCSVVNGSTNKIGDENHCWNMVNIGNDYFHVDVTWDIESNDSINGICYDYFGLTDSDLINRKWRNYYPACNCNSYNYFILSKAVASNDTQLCEIAKRQLMKNKRVYLKYAYLDKKMTQEQVANYVFELLQKNRETCFHFFGRFTCRANLDQNIILIEEK